MGFLRLWVVVLVLTLISWLLLKLIRKPMHIGLVFLFWVAVIFVSTFLLYAISVWFVSS